MSWLKNWVFGESSDESGVPDSYEGTAICDSYEKPFPSNLREEEVVSGNRYRDNTVELDLNIPLEDPYAQQGYSNYGYSGEAYPQAEYPYGVPNYSEHGYGGEHSFVQQVGRPDLGDDGEQEDVLVDEDGCYPVTFSFDTTQTFSSRIELMHYVQQTAKYNGYLIVVKRSNKRGQNYKIWLQCTLGGEHKSVATQRLTGSKKNSCPFEMIGFSESNGTVFFFLISEVYEYLMKSWLDPFREKFVSCWTNKTLNFHQTTTNRVEGMHATLKRLFPSHCNTLDKIVLYVDHVVDRQYTEIRSSFETSLRKVMNHHKDHPMLAKLLKKVSLFAIDLLCMELKRKEDGLRAYGASCGCQLFTSCGLPCACRLENMEINGEELRINSIDAFWKKLDFKPARSGMENMDVDGVFSKLKQQIDLRPPQVQWSVLEKFNEIVNPENSNKKPPVVLKKTRGRPTLQKQEEMKAEAARKSSYIPAEESWFEASHDLPRHSSYVSSQDKGKQKNKEPLNLHPDFPMINLGPKTDIAIRNYATQIPKCFHPYIVKIKDVKPDGHCGFRSVAVGLGEKQTKYLNIRKKLLRELRVNEQIWRQFFDPDNLGHYEALYRRIDFQGVGRAPIENYMTMPDAGFLIAQQFGVIVHTFDIRGSDTIFPLLGGPYEAELPHEVVVVGFVNGGCVGGDLFSGHFINIELAGSYPMPPPNILWTINRRSAAAAWHTLYRDQISAYESLMYKPTYFGGYLG